MYGHIRQAFLYLKAQPLFFSSCLILSCLIAVTQYQFWFGDYSKGDLNKLKDEIALVELETDILKKKNQELLQEKNKLQIRTNYESNAENTLKTKQHSFI